MTLDALPIYGHEKPMPTAHDLRCIYEDAQAVKPMLAALISDGTIKMPPSDRKLSEQDQRIHKANEVSTRWLTASMQVGAAWVGSLWEAQARAMLDALPSFDDVGRVGLLRTLYGVHSGDDGEPVVVVVAFDFVGVPHDFRLCRPLPQEAPHQAAHRATYDHRSALWCLRDTYATNAGPCRQWVMEPSNATDVLGARLRAAVRDNPTPSHLSLLRALHELASVAVGHTPPDQTPAFDALALAFPQVMQAKAKAQAYALTLQREPKL